MNPGLQKLRKASEDIGDELNSLHPDYRRRVLDAFANAAGLALGYVPEAHQQIFEVLKVCGYEPVHVEEAIRLDDVAEMPVGPDLREKAATRRRVREEAWAEANRLGQTREEQRLWTKRALRKHGVPMPR